MHWTKLFCALTITTLSQEANLNTFICGRYNVYII